MVNERGTATEVFLVFLKLGLTAFGGPAAHIGYFHRELVERRHWLDAQQFAQLLALSQFLPGPGSSKLGFSLGLLRAGWRGGLAAFIAFTLPSALLMFAFAALLPLIEGSSGQALVHGLKLVALAVVSHAVLTMARTLCPDWQRAGVAGLSVIPLLVFGGPSAQLMVIALGLVAGLILCRHVTPTADAALPLPYGKRTGGALLILCLLLLLTLPWLGREAGGLLAVADNFYRTGALTFGGGHVVLPLLEEQLVTSGWISRDDFLAGYGAAQAIPGPMFAFAAYLGALLPDGQGGVAGATVALLMIFLPGLLLIAGVLPLWQLLARQRWAAQAVAGINAAVVGLLAFTLVTSVWPGAVFQLSDVLIAAIGWLMLSRLKLSALLVVLWCVAASLLVSA